MKAVVKKEVKRLLTEQMFIEKFKKEGFELYKTSEIQNKTEYISKLETECNNQSMRLSNLKDSFNMVKNNYEREKSRLDKVIELAWNNSKPVINGVPVSELTAKNDCRVSY